MVCQGENWLDDGAFTLTLDDGNDLFFIVNADRHGDRMFERRLRKLVTNLRTQAGKSPPHVERIAEDSAATPD